MRLVTNTHGTTPASLAVAAAREPGHAANRYVRAISVISSDAVR